MGKVATSTTENLQDLNYAYDNVGNITQIFDIGGYNSAKVTDYLYDDLYRLTTASTTFATTTQTNYKRTYTYSPTGNITNKSDQGNYLYQGDQGASYANPHAVTDINGTTYTYDKNGNLTSDTVWTYGWNYNNTLASSTNGVITVDYGYDHNKQRISYDNGIFTTYYPNKYFNQSTATTTRHIFAGNQLIAAIEGTGTATSTNYIHTDHLGSTHIVTDESGNKAQLLDYYPFGDLRLNETDALDEQRKFTGHEYDDDTDLTYANARYYDQGIGRFTGQDPAFLAVGDGRALEATTGTKLQGYLSNPQGLNSRWATVGSGLNSASGFGLKKNTVAAGNLTSGWAEILTDPQMQNSYSYSRNNPLAFVDPTGETAYYFNFNTNVGLGAEGGNSWTIGFATDGTYGISTSVHGGALMGIDASIGVSAGYSNAQTWSDTLGVGQYAQVGGKIIFGGGVTTNLSNGKYTGTEVGIGLGARGLPAEPIAYSAGLNKTYPVFQSNVQDAINNVNSGYNAVRNAATSGANAVRQGASSLSNYVKSRIESAYSN